MDKMHSILRWGLLLVGGMGTVWFVIPLTVQVLNIGNLSGMALSLIFVGAGVFYSNIRACIHKLKQRKGGRILFRCLCSLVTVVFLSVAVLTFFMVWAACKVPPEEATVVVLGCKVNGTEPSLMLTQRLQAARKYLSEHPDASCIVSGGQGKNEQISEAQAMKTWLVEHEIEETRIYLEDLSTNTEENLRFSQQIIEEQKLCEEIAIVTDGFHQLRASIIAKKQGLTPYSVPADTPWFVFSAYYVRELFALGEELVLQ